MTRRHKLDRSGSAMITVMIILVIVVTAGAAMMGVAGQQAYAVRQTRDTVRARAIAEAGAHAAYAALKADWSARESDAAFPETEFGDGVYDATVTPVGDNMASISCVGTYNGVTTEVKCDVKDFAEASGASGGGASPPPVGAYACALLAGGDMDWMGSGSTDMGAGRVHCNGAFKMVGTTDAICGLLSSCEQIWSTGTTTITGDTRAPAYKGKSPGNVSGTAETGAVDPVALPAIDLIPYYQHALDNGEVYNGDVHWSGSGVLACPVGGVMWVNGDLQFSGSGELTGCFIATGEIRVSGSGDHHKVGSLPAFISRDGEIKYTGSGQVEGLMYAMTGGFEKNGSGDMIGSIFCAGDFKKSGSWNLMTYVDSTPVPPDEGGAGGAVPPPPANDVGITAWHQ